MPFKAKNNREAVVVCAIHVVKRPSKRSVLVYIYIHFNRVLSNCKHGTRTETYPNIKNQECHFNVGVSYLLEAH